MANSTWKMPRARSPQLYPAGFDARTWDAAACFPGVTDENGRSCGRLRDNQFPSYKSQCSPTLRSITYGNYINKQPSKPQEMPWNNSCNCRTLRSTFENNKPIAFAGKWKTSRGWMLNNGIPRSHVIRQHAPSFTAHVPRAVYKLLYAKTPMLEVSEYFVSSLSFPR